MSRSKSPQNIFEQHKFNGYTITVENNYGNNELYGFAVSAKYSHLLNYYNLGWVDKIAEENGIKIIEKENEDWEYEGLDYIFLDPDTVDPFLKNVNTLCPISVLNYMKNEILNRNKYE
jgi:hypothetical protein